MNNNFIGSIKTINEESAINYFYNKLGSASRYTGAGLNSFTAERC